MISPEKVIIIIALLFIICVMPFPIGLLMFKFKSEKLKAEVRKNLKKPVWIIKITKKTTITTLIKIIK